MATKKLEAVTLLLSDNRGVYIPRDFCDGFDMKAWGLAEDDRDVMTCKAGPSSEYYWDAWDTVMSNARYVSEGQRGEWHLYQDGDLWALNTELMTDEEKQNFGYDED